MYGTVKLTPLKNMTINFKLRNIVTRKLCVFSLKKTLSKFDYYKTPPKFGLTAQVR